MRTLLCSTFAALLLTAGCGLPDTTGTTTHKIKIQALGSGTVKEILWVETGGSVQYEEKPTLPFIHEMVLKPGDTASFTVYMVSGSATLNLYKDGKLWLTDVSTPENTGKLVGDIE